MTGKRSYEIFFLVLKELPKCLLIHGYQFLENLLIYLNSSFPTIIAILCQRFYLNFLKSIIHDVNAPHLDPVRSFHIRFQYLDLDKLNIQFLYQ